MNLAFLFPFKSPIDSIAEWVRTLARYTSHEVRLVSTVAEAMKSDMVFPVTQQETYPAHRLNEDISVLRENGKPFGVVHNQDEPGVPHAGTYPSFCWTQQAKRRLEEVYHPILLRQPVLPRCVEPKERPLHLGTFGRIEKKKKTLEMAQLAERLGVPFTVFAAVPLLSWVNIGAPEAWKLNEYIQEVRKIPNVLVTFHPWLPQIELLRDIEGVDKVSHWLFVLPESKGGTGGSPTCPRYATAFGRPVIVVDDEHTFCDDGFVVIPDLSTITRYSLGLPVMQPPSYTWTPDAYLSTLIAKTAEHWRK